MTERNEQTILVYDEGGTHDEYDPLMMDCDPVVGIQFWTHRTGNNPEHIVMSMFTERRWKTASLDADRARELGEALIRWADTIGAKP